MLLKVLTVVISALYGAMMLFLAVVTGALACYGAAEHNWLLAVMMTLLLIAEIVSIIRNFQECADDLRRM